MLRWFAGVLLVWFSLSATALAQVGLSTPGLASGQHAEASLISERAAIAPGDTFLAALRLDIEEGGWHVYWKNAGDSGLPPEIDWTLPEGVSVGEFSWPTPHIVRLNDLANYAYESELVLPFEVVAPATAVPGEELVLTGRASWLICLEICVPEGADVRIALPVEAAPRPNADNGAMIAAALETVPLEMAGSASFERAGDTFVLSVADASVAGAVAAASSFHFFPDGAEIVHAAPQGVSYGPEGVQLTLAVSQYAKAQLETLSGVLVAEGMEDAAGLRPAWVVKALLGPAPAGVSGASLENNVDARTGALAPTAAGWAAILGFAFLGGLVLNLMPCVLPVLSIKAASLARTAHAPAEARAHGLAYLGGVLVCFAAIGLVLAGLRAVGEQAGLGFQLQYPPVVAFFALAMFAIGLNLLGLFEIGGSLQNVGGGLAQKSGVTGAFFTGMLAAFVGAPCVGPFMAPAVGVALEQPAPIVVGVFLLMGLGLAAPLVLISFTPALARLLPKPGAWMETFRQVLAFPMFLTAIWLLWVLAGQAGSDAVLLTVIGATVLGFGVWLARRAGGGISGRVAATVAIVAAFVGPTLASGRMQVEAVAAEASGQVAETASEAWSPERVAQLRAEKRVIFVDFTARWCVTCQVNERGALASREVREAFLKHNVVTLVGDWTNRDTVIAGELARHGRAGVPLYLLYPADGGEPKILPQLLSAGAVVKDVASAAAPTP